MYLFFIELHDQKSNQLVNIDTITNVYVDNDGVTTIGIGDEYIEVTESYPEVKALIEGCGCLINKADPRLDTSKPLTMEDLKDMVGQPVWNSNTGEWMLVCRIDVVAGEDFAVLVESDGIGYDFGEAMLKAKPMYRMKQ